MAFFPIVIMVLGVFDQLQIFWQWYLIELLGLLTGLGLHELSTWHIQGFWQGLTCWSSSQTWTFYEILGQVFGLISSLLNNRQVWVVLVVKFLEDYPVNAGVLQDSVLSLYFFYYSLIMLLMILPMILLFMLMILPSTLNVIRHLICGNN